MTADRPVVFVVDDDARVREALSSLLASAGTRSGRVCLSDRVPERRQA